MSINKEIRKEVPYKHPYANIKSQKKIRCVVVNKSEYVEYERSLSKSLPIEEQDRIARILESPIGEMPTLVAKPKTVKYGTKGFYVNGKYYHIIYSYLKDFGKYYLYLTVEGNSVGGIKFDSHKEFADAEQVAKMMDYGTVNLFKQNNLRKVMRILTILAIVLMVAVIASFILMNVVMGQNGQITRLNAEKVTLNTQIETLRAENNQLKGIDITQQGVNR